MSKVFLFYLFVFQIVLFIHFLFCADIVESKAKFAEAAWKGKVVAGATAPPPKRACHAEEIITLPPPLVAEELASTKPKSSTRGEPEAVPAQDVTSQEEAEVEVSWPRASST